jgi:GDP-D-mannose dehydratase
MVRAAFESIDVHDWEKLIEVDSSFSRINDPRVTVGNPSMIYEKLGWSASKTFTEMVSEMVRHDVASLSDNCPDSGKLWVSKFLS